MPSDRRSDTPDRERFEQSTTLGPVELPVTEGEPPTIDSLDAHLPAATVDSRWWYWIAAVPVYFLVSLLLVAGAGLVASVAVAIGARWLLLLTFAVLFVLISLPGLTLAVLFPLAMYVDARAVALSGADWRPDPVLHGVAALLAVLVTAFVLSVPLALYYLYNRHLAVGQP